MTNALALRAVSKRYDHFYLRDISLQLPTGQIMGLVGVNGAGKSTLLRILMGLVQPDRGDVEVLGFPIPQQQVAAKRDIGFASEDMRLYPSQTLRWHIDFIRSIYPSWDQQYAEQLLRRFDLNSAQIMKGVSHGQRVKALLLLNLARRPKLLLLDEPTTGLDPVARAEVLEALADVLRDESRSVLFSSHNTHDIEQLSDSISFIHQGQLLASQDKESFLDNWRRLMCQGTESFDLASFPEIASCKQNGSLYEIKVNHFDDALPQRLQQRGLQVSSINTMSLEDIFVTTVRRGVNA